MTNTLFFLFVCLSASWGLTLTLFQNCVFSVVCHTCGSYHPWYHLGWTGPLPPLCLCASVKEATELQKQNGMFFPAAIALWNGWKIKTFGFDDNCFLHVSVLDRNTSTWCRLKCSMGAGLWINRSWLLPICLKTRRRRLEVSFPFLVAHRTAMKVNHSDINLYLNVSPSIWTLHDSDIPKYMYSPNAHESFSLFRSTQHLIPGF